MSRRTLALLAAVAAIAPPAAAQEPTDPTCGWFAIAVGSPRSVIAVVGTAVAPDPTAIRSHLFCEIISPAGTIEISASRPGPVGIVAGVGEMPTIESYTICRGASYVYPNGDVVNVARECTQT